MNWGFFLCWEWPELHSVGTTTKTPALQSTHPKHLRKETPPPRPTSSLPPRTPCFRLNHMACCCLWVGGGQGEKASPRPLPFAPSLPLHHTTTTTTALQDFEFFKSLGLQELSQARSSHPVSHHTPLVPPPPSPAFLFAGRSGASGGGGAVTLTRRPCTTHPTKMRKEKGREGEGGLRVDGLSRGRDQIIF